MSAPYSLLNETVTHSLHQLIAWRVLFAIAYLLKAILDRVLQQRDLFMTSEEVVRENCHLRLYCVSKQNRSSVDVSCSGLQRNSHSVVFFAVCVIHAKLDSELALNGSLLFPTVAVCNIQRWRIARQALYRGCIKSRILGTQARYD